MNIRIDSREHAALFTTLRWLNEYWEESAVPLAADIIKLLTGGELTWKSN